MNKSGAHGACRGRQSLGAVSSGIRYEGEIDASAGLAHRGLPGRLVNATLRITRGTALAPKGTKKPPPRLGDERCQARGTTPLRGRTMNGHLNPHGAKTRDAAAR